MKRIRSHVGGAFLASTLLSVQLTGQRGENGIRSDPVARVEVLAFEASGRFLGSPNVTIFSSDHGHNLANEFHNGAASGIPYGLYRIEGGLPGYYSDAKFIRVYQPVVTVVVGLRFAEELPMVPPSLRGRVAGTSGSGGKIFVRLVGLYENVSIESTINNDGEFSLAGLSSGLFLLLVVGEKGILASQSLTVPYTGPPIVIKVNGGSIPSPAR